MRIVIVGHAASPDRGSEPGQSWNWAWYLSQHHDVWLVNFPEFRAEVDRFLSSNPNRRLQVVWVHTSAILDPWRPDRNSTGPSFKIHYMLWLRQVQRVVRDLVRTQAIDIVHQVGLITISAPSSLWRLPVPFVWGPIGGGETAPFAFRSYYGDDWGRERGRRVRIGLIRHIGGLRNTVRHARYLFAVNAETRAVLIRAGADPARIAMLMDTGVRPGDLRAAPRPVAHGAGARGSELTLLWVGRLEARKALPILLDALDGLAETSAAGGVLPIRVLVAGKGPKRAAWEQHAELRGVARWVTFLGEVAPDQMADLYERADLFVFTSLQDAFGSVVMEAMAQGLPVVALDHQGCAALLPDAAAIKVPVTTPRETVSALTAVLEELRRDPHRLHALSAQALHVAEQVLWPARAAAMARLYEGILLSAP